MVLSERGRISSWRDVLVATLSQVAREDVSCFLYVNLKAIAIELEDVKINTGKIT